MIPVAVLVLILAVPLFGESDFDQGECGKFSPNATPVPIATTGTPVSKGQWPWRVSIFANFGMGEQFRCGGTLVSRRHIITSAQRITQEGTRNPLDKNILTIYAGKLSFSDPRDGTPIIFLKKITIHPGFIPTIRPNNLAIIELWEDISWDWVMPACLWPEELTDLSNIIHRSGSVVGWGYDRNSGRSNSDKLMQMQLPIVDRQTCIDTSKPFFEPRVSDLTYCAGNRDGATTRNNNPGEGMVFNNGGTWYLRGFSSICVAFPNTNSCHPDYYAVFTDIAKYLPWIRENMNDF